MRAVLLPALGEPPSSLYALKGELAARGVGTAEIVSRCRGVGYVDHVAQARAAVAQADDGSQPVAIIGASYGGMVAAGAVARLAGERGGDAGAVARLRMVMLDSPHPLTHAAVRGFVGRRAEVTLPNSEGVDLAAALATMRASCGPGSLGAVPLLVVSRGPGTWPGADPDIPSADRVWLAHQRLHTLMSRRSSLVVLPGVGHAVAALAPAVVADLVTAQPTDADRRCGQS